MHFITNDMWCWIRHLRVPWTARRSNQSILKEVNLNIHWKDWSWSWIRWMLRLKLQYFGYLMQRANSLEKTLMLGKIEGQRRRGMTEDEMVGGHHWHNGHEFEQVLGDDEGQGSLVCCSPWGHKESDMTKWLNNNHRSYINVPRCICKICIGT